MRRHYANFRDWGGNRPVNKEFIHLEVAWNISSFDIKHKHMEIVEAEFDVGMKPYDRNEIVNRVVQHFIEN